MDKMQQKAIIEVDTLKKRFYSSFGSVLRFNDKMVYNN